MRIFITVPSFSVHGGIRIICEWANRLAQNNTVYLRPLKPGPCRWFPISPSVQIVDHDRHLPSCDILLITSPHSIGYADRTDRAKKTVLFLQMMEHMFRPDDIRWGNICRRMYQSEAPMFSISQWNIEMMRDEFGRTAPTFYIGNGVNFDHFRINPRPKKGSVVLVEGWSAGNPSKDALGMGPRVANRLKQEGSRILSYGARPPADGKGVIDYYAVCPSLQQMNDLYEEATIVLKASVCDARACAPVEAMTKGTVTARAITKGDDDLIDGENCLKTEYDEEMLYQSARRLLDDTELRARLSSNALNHVQKYSWDYWMPIIEQKLREITYE